MVDYVRIKVNAGKGGDGVVSFQTSRTKAKGPPDGGDGGSGGDAYLEVSKDLSTLITYNFKKNFKAASGERGGPNNKKGAKGKDLVLPVPPGTKISDEKGRLFADLTKEGERVMVAKGGSGGRGNSHVKRSEFTRRPDGQAIKADELSGEKQKKNSEFVDMWHYFEKGEEGQEAQLTLELKLLADVGLVGLPNAGKSTLLSKLTKATPKIASYPFTTIEPVLGVMRHHGQEIVIADIPGLIEGASQGKGLGDLFLRHIERTNLILHLVSVENEDIEKAIESINKELEEYSQELKNKTLVYILTKIDLLTEEEIKNKLSQTENMKIKTLQISAVSGEGLDKLKDELIKRLKSS